VAKPEDAFERRFAELREGLLRVGTVTGTAAGGKVLVNVDGESKTLPRLTSYTPVNGHVVLVLCVKPGAWFVLGTPALS
jgi:hypothetical protein